MKKIKLNNKTIYISIISLVLVSVFINCGQRLTSNTDTPLISETITDPWNPPLGELVQGAQLSDGWTDLRILEGGVNIDGGWTDSVAVTPDGRRLYFSYSRFSFSEFFDSVNYSVFNPTGPFRIGMTGDHFKMFRADLSGSKWNITFSPFNTLSNLHEFAESPNLNEDIIVTTQYVNSAGDLYYTVKTDGVWSPLLSISVVPGGSQINSICDDQNSFVVGSLATGLRLYFESTRSNLSGSACGTLQHIYFSDYDPVTNSFSAVQAVPGINSFTSTHSDTQPSFTHDKKHAYWTGVRDAAYGVFTAELVGNAYMNARPIIQPNFVSPFAGKLSLIGEANIAEFPEGWLLYMMCGIAQSEQNNQPKDIKLKICVARKYKNVESQKINTAGWSDSPFISRDGKRLYFMYSRWDFAPWIKSGGVSSPVLAGPDRPGLQKVTVNPFDESDIYMSTKNDDGTWSEPVNLGLNGAYGDASGMEINNGQSFVWLRGNGVTTNQIVRADKNADGTWGAPVSLSAQINLTNTVQDNPHISEDGNGVWFTSDRAGGQGAKDIWFSFNSGGVWSAPVNLSTTFNSSGDEDQMWISPISNEIYWNTSQGIKTCVSNGSSCAAAPQLMSIPGCDFAAEVSMPDDGQTMYFGCGNATTGRVNIMYSEKQANGSWGTAKPVD